MCESEKFTIIFEHSMAATKNAKNDWKMARSNGDFPVRGGLKGLLSVRPSVRPGFQSTTETMQKAMTKQKIGRKVWLGGGGGDE